MTLKPEKDFKNMQKTNIKKSCRFSTKWI